MLSVKATDYAGLKTEVKGDSFKFSMDSQSPDVSIEPEAGKNRKYFNDDVRIKTSVADSISGVVSAKYQIVTDDQSVSDDEGAWNELDESGIINVSAEAYLDKKVDVYVKAVDEAKRDCSGFDSKRQPAILYSQGSACNNSDIWYI